MHFIHSHSQKEKVAKKKEERPTIYFLSSPTTTARKTTTALMKLHDILTCLNYTTFLNGLDMIDFFIALTAMFCYYDSGRYPLSIWR